jgi:hypothetical protein
MDNVTREFTVIIRLVEQLLLGGIKVDGRGSVVRGGKRIPVPPGPWWEALSAADRAKAITGARETLAAEVGSAAEDLDRAGREMGEHQGNPARRPARTKEPSRPPGERRPRTTPENPGQ